MKSQNIICENLNLSYTALHPLFHAHFIKLTKIHLTSFLHLGTKHDHRSLEGCFPHVDLHSGD